MVGRPKLCTGCIVLALTGRHWRSLAAAALLRGHNGDKRRADSHPMTTTPAASLACANAAPHRREACLAVVNLADGRADPHFDNCHKRADRISLPKATEGDIEWR
jgi:hypothetical protein